MRFHFRINISNTFIKALKLTFTIIGNSNFVVQTILNPDQDLEL